MRLLAPPLLALALLTGCVDLDQARSHAAKQKAANEGHAADESLPPAARQIGQVNAEAWAAQEKFLGGEE